MRTEVYESVYSDIQNITLCDKHHKDLRYALELTACGAPGYGDCEACEDDGLVEVYLDAFMDSQEAC